MALKHLLLGLAGSAAIGGIGYGIYSSSQSSENEGQRITDIENPSNQGRSDSKLLTEDEDGGSVKQQGKETEDKNDSSSPKPEEGAQTKLEETRVGQGGDGGGRTDDNLSGISPQSKTSSGDGVGQQENK